MTVYLIERLSQKESIKGNIICYVGDIHIDNCFEFMIVTEMIV
jgi:hypothetical protein